MQLWSINLGKSRGKYTVKKRHSVSAIGKLDSSVQSFSRVRLFVTPWTAACQASLSITNSQNLPKLMSMKSVMPSSHLILCHPLLLLPSIFPSISVFSNGSALRIRWPKYWSFSFSISPANEPSGLISFRTDSFCYGEGGGRRVHVWERMYTRDGFMSMYGKTTTML